MSILFLFNFTFSSLPSMLNNSIPASLGGGYIKDTISWIRINNASIQLLKKFNFEEWGKLPIHSNFNGKRYGRLYYGLNLD